MRKTSSFLKNLYISKIQFITKDSGLQVYFYIRLKCECIISCILFCFCATRWKTSTIFTFYFEFDSNAKQLIKFLFVILTSTYINKFSSVFKLSVPLFLRNLIGGAFPLWKRFYRYLFSNGNSIWNHQGKSKSRWQ